MAGNNAINRWKDTMGFPQEREGSRFQRGDKPVTTDRALPLKSFLTPTAEKYRGAVSRLAPGRSTASRRPPLEPRADVEAALEACRTRKPRLPLVGEEKARALLADALAGPLPNWVRLLANFPRAGLARVASTRAAEDKGDLKPLLKAQVSWIAARQDRAWYALGHARQRLKALGLSDDEIYALDGPWDSRPAGERAAFHLARKVTATPDLVVDADVAELRKHHSDREVTQLVHYLTVKAFFHRVTEASGLPLEGK